MTKAEAVDILTRNIKEAEAKADCAFAAGNCTSRRLHLDYAEACRDELRRITRDTVRVQVGS